MQTTLKFICCFSYDFKDDSGERITGITCKCFDEESGKIVKVKTNHMIDACFADEIIVNVIPNGNYLTYEVA